MASGYKAFEIDLDRIRKEATALTEAKAEQDRQAADDSKNAIKAQQTELNVALGAAGLPLIAVDGIVGPQTRQAELDVAALDDGPIDPSTVMPDDQTTDAYGQTKYLEDENGNWYNNDKFYEKPVKPADADTAPSGKYTTWQDAHGNTVWVINPDYDPAAADKSSGSKGDDWEEHLRTLSAKGSITAYFKSFGLEGISEWAYAQLSSGYDVDTVLMQMRYGSSTVAVDNDMYVPEAVRTTYDTRFPAMALRDTDDKTAPLTEAQYIDLETGYWQIIDTAGMGTYADAEIAAGTNLISNLIVGDVSLAEFQGRIGQAEEIAFNTNAEVQAALQDKWGWGKGEFITAMFDPDNMTLKEAKRTIRGATLSGTAQRALGGTAGGSELAFSKQLGLDLAALDIQSREVQSQMGALSGLTSSTPHSDALSADQLGEGVWGSGKARSSMRRTVEGRTAGFSGKSGGLTTAGGIASYGSTST